MKDRKLVLQKNQVEEPSKLNPTPSARDIETILQSNIQLLGIFYVKF